MQAQEQQPRRQPLSLLQPDTGSHVAPISVMPAPTRRQGSSRTTGSDAREMTEGGLCAGALGARVGRRADELGALFPQAPCELVVLGLVTRGHHLFVFDVLPGEGSGVVG